MFNILPPSIQGIYLRKPLLCKRIALYNNIPNNKWGFFKSQLEEQSLDEDRNWMKTVM